MYIILYINVSYILQLHSLALLHLHLIYPFSLIHLGYKNKFKQRLKNLQFFSRLLHFATRCNSNLWCFALLLLLSIWQVFLQKRIAHAAHNNLANWTFLFVFHFFCGKLKHKINTSYYNWDLCVVVLQSLNVFAKLRSIMGNWRSTKKERSILN